MTEQINIFVYGMLMTGESLHHLVANDIWRKSPATIRGEMYPYLQGGYPVVYGATAYDTSISEDAVVHGEVFTVYLSKAVQEVIAMERESGYEPRWVTATFENGDTVKAMMFHWSHGNRRGLLGEPIKSGRWKDYRPAGQAASSVTLTVGEMIESDQELRLLMIDYLYKTAKQDHYDEYTMTDAERDLDILMFNDEHTEYLLEIMKAASS